LVRIHIATEDVKMTGIGVEYPEVKSYVVHPGIIATRLYEESKFPIEVQDTVELPAATFLWLTSRNAEFLSGR
jgi:hypothetical protein